MGNETTNLLVLNAVAVWIIQALKGSKYVPWITAETEAVNKFVSAAFAALASAGVAFTAVHTGGVSEGALTISWAGITVANVVSFLYHAVAYYAAQKAFFKVTVPPAQG